MLTRDEIIETHRLTDYLVRKGVDRFPTNICPAAQHKPDHRCVTIDPSRQLWHCNDCDRGGSIIDWMMAESGRSAKQVMEELGMAQASANGHRPNKAAENKEKKIVAIYDYVDQNDEVVFQSVRYEPKSFRQRRPDGKGGWIWDLTGVTRVLYNLPRILRNQTIAITEGEKDCGTLDKLGYTTTCNSGGAKNWLAAYGDTLKGKDVVIIPDNDQPGAQWAEAIIASVADKAASVKLVRVPLPHKDVSDWNPDAPTLAELIVKTPHQIPPDPFFNFTEGVKRYHIFSKRSEEFSFDLCKFLPSLGTRPLVPGELALILADTGVGKSMLLQSIAKYANPLPTLFFELELPLELMTERFIQLETGCYGHEVIEDFRNSDSPDEFSFPAYDHILVCPEAGLGVARIEQLILRSELRFGRPPVLVIVDYIGLVKGTGKNRYESISDSAEAMKVIAKRTDTIIVMASQIARPDAKKKTNDVSLHSAKDSGALENSAGLVLGCWRPEPRKLTIRILKNTKGLSGHQVECEIDAARMRIKELQ